MSVNETIAQPTMRTPQTNNAAPVNEIDLLALFGTLLDRKWFITIITAIFSIVGVAIAVLSAPIYQATVMIWPVCLRAPLKQ